MMGCLHFSVNPVSLFVALIILLCEVKIGDCMHTQFCFRFPKGSFPDETYQHTGRTDVNSVGIEKFPQNIWDKYIFSLEFPGNPYDGFTETSGANSNHKKYHNAEELRPILRVHPIYGRTHGSDPLSGWFRIVLTYPILEGWTEFVKSFVLYATDEQANFIGTWERSPFTGDSQDCPKSDETKYMIIPCGGVSKYAPHVSNAILYARKNKRKDGEVWPKEYQNLTIVPDYKGKYDLTFYWRYSMQDSNRNKEQHILFRFFMDPDHKYDVVGENFPIELDRLENVLIATSAVVKFYPEAVPGAADALPTKRTSMSCTDNSVTLYGGAATVGGKNKYASYHWHWYFDFFHGDVGQDIKNSDAYINLLTGVGTIWAYQIDTRAGCTSNFYEGRCVWTKCTISKQQGEFKRNYVNKSLIPQVHSTKTATCSRYGHVYEHTKLFIDQHDKPMWFNNARIQFKDWWYEYLESVAGKRCDKTEAEVNGTGNKVRVIRKNTRNNTNFHYGNQTYFVSGEKPKFAIEDLYRRGVRQYGFGTVLYAIRKGHGIVMLLLTLFFTPVSIFVSRYYKETFMSTRALYAKLWFQIHIQLVFWMCALFATGLLLAVLARGFLGVSLVPLGIAHRIVGWTSFGFFVILLLTGGIRAMDDPWRAVTIGAHFFLGYFFYMLNVVAVITSFYIPGSPAANHDESIDDETKADKLAFVLAGWCMFEFVIHVSMTFLIYSYDRWMEVKAHRKFIPPILGVPIPVLKENSDSDASGDGIRLVVFCIYIGMAALISFVGALAFLTRHAEKQLGFGPMSCTHVYDPSLTPPRDSYDYGIYQFRMLDKLSNDCKWEY